MQGNRAFPSLSPVFTGSQSHSRIRALRELCCDARLNSHLPSESHRQEEDSLSSATSSLSGSAPSSRFPSVALPSCPKDLMSPCLVTRVSWRWILPAFLPQETSGTPFHFHCVLPGGSFLPRGPLGARVPRDSDRATWGRTVCPLLQGPCPCPAPRALEPYLTDLPLPSWLPTTGGRTRSNHRWFPVLSKSESSLCCPGGVFPRPWHRGRLGITPPWRWSVVAINSPAPLNPEPESTGLACVGALRGAGRALGQGGRWAMRGRRQASTCLLPPWVASSGLEPEAQ